MNTHGVRPGATGAFGRNCSEGDRAHHANPVGLMDRRQLPSLPVTPFLRFCAALGDPQRWLVRWPQNRNARGANASWPPLVVMFAGCCLGNTPRHRFGPDGPIRALGREWRAIEKTKKTGV